MALDWKGAQTREQVVAAVIDGLQEFGLKHETATKGQLQPGHGVLTGTLRRSIHSERPDYQWDGDNVVPTADSPERGGQAANLAEESGKVTVVAGSGMNYAEAIEELYGYLQAGHEKVLPELIPTIQKHAAARGLT